MFCRNVGKMDRIARIGLGAFLILGVFVGPKTQIGWVGLIPLITGFAGFCPLYPVFKINTCKKSN